MNKKQFLSIALLFSVVGANAQTWGEWSGLVAQPTRLERAKAVVTSGISQAKKQAVAGMSFVKANPTTTGLYAGTAAGLGYVAYRQYDNAKNALVATKNAVIDAAQNGYKSVKENPKTTAALVALTAGAGVGMYYKGGVLLAAAQNAVTKLPNRPEFVKTGLGYATGAANTVSSFAQKAASYVPTWAKDNVITRNPIMALSNAPFALQAGSDIVGLVGSNGSELAQTATEAYDKASSAVRSIIPAATEEVTPAVVDTTPATETAPVVSKRVPSTVARRHTDKFSLNLNHWGVKWYPAYAQCSNVDKVHFLQETLNWAKTTTTGQQYISLIEKTIAELS